jgi:fatty-acyl-CoA synthase
MLKITAEKHADRLASLFQMFSEHGSKAQTLSWRQMLEKVTQGVNLFRSLGVAEDDTVAYLLPGLNEAAITVTGAMIAGKANPINPLLEPEVIAAILREIRAKVLVTLKSFPKVDLAEKAAQAAVATDVETIVEIDMLPHLNRLKKLIVPMVRPKMTAPRKARVLNFHKALVAQPKDGLTFEESGEDRFCALFHTGGTTGTPKLAQHRISGAHMIQTTPAGYRGDAVFEKFWQVVEHWKISIIVTVPTAAAMLLNYPVNSDVSSLRVAISGSAPFPKKLFEEFEQKLGVSIVEGYSMTEATCIVTSKPPNGPCKVGSVGIPTPYCEVRVFECDDEDNIEKRCDTDEIGEICVLGPGVVDGQTYTDDRRNLGLYVVENGQS